MLGQSGFTILGVLPTPASAFLIPLVALEEAVEVAEDLPIFPLFFRQDIILSNPELEGIVSGFYPPLWNIESLR